MARPFRAGKLIHLITMNVPTIDYRSPAPPAASNRKSIARRLSLIAGACVAILLLSFILPYPIGRFLITVAFVVGTPLSIWAWVVALLDVRRHTRPRGAVTALIVASVASAVFISLLFRMILMAVEAIGV
jgi:hypothetical protein